MVYRLGQGVEWCFDMKQCTFAVESCSRVHAFRGQGCGAFASNKYATTLWRAFGAAAMTSAAQQKSGGHSFGGIPILFRTICMQQERSQHES